jgi:hypothetical protein
MVFNLLLKNTDFFIVQTYVMKNSFWKKHLDDLNSIIEIRIKEGFQLLIMVLFLEMNWDDLR